MRIVKEVRAPVRIDFAGGTTDITPFSTKYGGAVLNAAINKYVFGKLIATDKSVGLEYHSNIPTSSGLGSSGVMNLVWLALISQYKDKIKLAENVYNLEQATGLIGGKQDQYASAIGGINFFEFKDHKVKINRLNLSKKLIDELENRLVLVYTGPHYSGMLNKLAIQNLLKGKNTKNLLEIKKTAYEMKKALMKGKLDKFADLMIGAGCCMNREACLAGCPTISIYPDELPAVDKFLIDSGLMKHTLDKKQVVEWSLEYINNGKMEKKKVENIVEKFENPHETIMEAINKLVK